MKRAAAQRRTAERKDSARRRPPADLTTASPRAGVWLGEALRAALARPVPLIAASILIAVVCVTVLLTTGRTAASEQAVLDRLDSLGTQLVTVSDNGGSSQMQSASIPTIDSYSAASWALGLGPVTDVHNSAIPSSTTRVASRPIYGDVTKPLTLVSGRWPRPGEAVASEEAARTLGLSDGVGGVTDRAGDSTAVVGVFRASGSLRGLANVVAVAPESDDGSQPVLYIYAQASSLSTLDTLRAAVPDLVTASDSRKLTVEISESLQAARDAIATDLASSSRFLMLVTLGIGLAIVMITMFAATAERRSEFGRRRALGATRSAITALVVVQSMLAGVAGTILGLAAGAAATLATGGQLPPVTFMLGMAALSVITAAIAALPPAVIAAYRDPVRILRVP